MQYLRPAICAPRGWWWGGGDGRWLTIHTLDSQWFWAGGGDGRLQALGLNRLLLQESRRCGHSPRVPPASPSRLSVAGWSGGGDRLWPDCCAGAARAGGAAALSPTRAFTIPRRPRAPCHCPAHGGQVPFRTCSTSPHLRTSPLCNQDFFLLGLPEKVCQLCGAPRLHSGSASRR